jgi:hypothetical protein
MPHGTARALYVQLCSEFTTHCTYSLVLNLVPGIVSGTKKGLHVHCTCSCTVNSLYKCSRSVASLTWSTFKSQTSRGNSGDGHPKLVFKTRACTEYMTVQTQVCVYTSGYVSVVKRELKRIDIDGCRCNERLTAKTEGSKRLAHTGTFNLFYYETIERELNKSLT